MDIRERIIGACRELALENGLNRFTMDALARQAGVSKRTLYRYFASKEAVIEATLDDYMEKAAYEMKQILAREQNPLLFFNEVLRLLSTRGGFLLNPASLQDLRLHYPQLWAKIDTFRLTQMRSVIKQLLAHNPSVLHDIDPRIVETAFIAIIQNIVHPDFILENNLTFEETARQLSLLCAAFFK